VQGALRKQLVWYLKTQVELSKDKKKTIGRKWLKNNHGSWWWLFSTAK